MDEEEIPHSKESLFFEITRSAACLESLERNGTDTHLDWENIGEKAQEPTETDRREFDTLLFEMFRDRG